MVLFALAMGGFAIGTTEFASMSLVPYFSHDLQIDEPTAGHVISAYALGVVIGAPLIALLAARFPRRQLLLALMAVFALGNFLTALSPSYSWMLSLRFLSGLPHGAYFGVAALVAASLVPFRQRTQAVARTMLGLTVATIIGVPLANWIGQTIGWRFGFILVSLLALITVMLVWQFAPQDRPKSTTSPLQELSALKRKQVWITLGMGAIGFGGLFAVYTYAASTMLNITHVSPHLIPVVLGIFGLGMTCGTLWAAWAADRRLMLTAGGLLLWSAVWLAFYPLVTRNIWALSIVIFMIGTGGGLGTVLQTRLMDVAGDAQTLAAALNHSAFNFANALGPFLGGLAIHAGYGFPSTGWVGCGLALGGFIFWCFAMRDEVREKRAVVKSQA
ncbi:MFS transporter [Candidatus Paracaedibacter acanthamoebae]|uniref:MFS transporter n=1 Tax=Candidatus Odyssella acanthamoebae TaxID=91604 RepID=A0A077AWM9_9PROT|nr:MFS transporter [Candidatus Paracaedibacter acanthamoebae]